MDETLVKLCSDKVAHAKYKQLYGEKPSNKSKAVEWEAKRLVFFLAWDSCKRIMKERVVQEIKDFFALAYTEEVYINSKGEKFISLEYAEEFTM